MNEFFNKEEFLRNNEHYNNYVKDFATISKDSEGFIYIRVSTKGQTENSPEAQLKDILEYAVNHNIWIEKHNIFIDGGISGRHADKRVEFQKLMEIATSKKSKCNKLLIHKYDRFARNKEESSIYKSKLKKANVKLISIKEELPNDKKSALVLETQYEMLGELYSINLSDEVYKGARIQAKLGKHQTKPPYGYYKKVKEVIKNNGRDKIIREMVIKEDEANIVKMIFEKYINGMTPYKIAIELNDLGLTTRDGRVWYDNRVRYILNNITYLGYTHWTEVGEETIIAKGNFPQIITQEVWDKKEQMKANYKSISPNNEKTQVKKEHWLRGKLRCSNCGNVLVINNESFQCCGYTHGECKVSHSIKIEKMEKLVLYFLSTLTKDDIININIDKVKIHNNDETSIIIEKIDQLNTKKERVMSAYENEIYDIDEFKERKTKIDKEINNLKENLLKLKEKENINKLKEEIYKKCDNIVNTINDPNIPIIDKRLMINEPIDKIIFDKKNKSLSFYYKGLQ